jgi:hypothetical protein
VPISPPFDVRSIPSAATTVKAAGGVKPGNFKFRRPAYLSHAANALYMAIFQQSKRIAIA